MTRIIAGAAGGLRLRVPKVGTRPTSDRVRESLFQALESEALITGARVVDLYAGSGALGLESLSRGASSAVFVERGRDAATIAKQNAASLTNTLADVTVEVRTESVQHFLRSASGPFDLAFIDPPYDLDTTHLERDLIALTRILSLTGVAVVERAARSPAPDWATCGLHLWREKSYGDTIVWWAEPA